MQYICGVIMLKDGISGFDLLLECESNNIPVSNLEKSGNGSRSFRAYFHVKDAAHYAMLLEIIDRSAMSYSLVDHTEYLVSGIWVS